MATQEKRRETRRRQRETAWHSAHPRSLARSVAKFINSQSGSEINSILDFREKTAGLPKHGRDRIHPKVTRKCRKIDT